MNRDKLSRCGQLADGRGLSERPLPVHLPSGGGISLAVLSPNNQAVEEDDMPHMHPFMWMVIGLMSMIAVPAFAADPPSQAQLERLMDMASQTPDRPDHNYVMNSLQALLRQGENLKLSEEQTEKIKAVADRYERTRAEREAAYKQSEMDALKQIHDSRSSLSSIEQAVH